MDNTTQANWHIGQLVQHKLFNYRGVVYDVDPVFMLSEDWYRQMALSRPPRDEPWYHVLVDGSDQQTYVAQRNLEAARDNRMIEHAAIGHYFSTFENGRYVVKQRN